MDRLEALRSIARDAASGELSFPTHAQLALKIKTALDDPDCSVDQAARLIQADPLPRRGRSAWPIRWPTTAAGVRSRT
jgi:hypothetical protein